MTFLFFTQPVSLNRLASPLIVLGLGTRPPGNFITNRYEILHSTVEQVPSNSNKAANVGLHVTKPNLKLKNDKKIGSVLLYADSHGRGLAERIQAEVEMNVIGTVKPGAPTEEVVKNVDCDLNKNDCVVLISGSNDVSKNESKKFLTNLKSRLSQLTSTNVVVTNLPMRHDLPHFSIVNKEIQSANMQVGKLCKRFQNVSVVDVSIFQRHLHTRHGLHLNLQGKDLLACTITKIIKNKVNKCSPIALKGNNTQGN